MKPSRKKCRKFRKLPLSPVTRFLKKRKKRKWMKEREKSKRKSHRPKFPSLPTTKPPRSKKAARPIAPKPKLTPHTRVLSIMPLLDFTKKNMPRVLNITKSITMKDLTKEPTARKKPSAPTPETSR